MTYMYVCRYHFVGLDMGLRLGIRSGPIYNYNNRIIYSLCQ